MSASSRALSWQLQGTCRSGANALLLPHGRDLHARPRTAQCPGSWCRRVPDELLSGSGRACAGVYASARRPAQAGRLLSGGCYAPNPQARVGSGSRFRISRSWTSRNSPRRLCPHARLRSGRDGPQSDQPKRSSLIGQSQCVQPKCRPIRRHDPECAQPERDPLHLCSAPHRARW
jgi:hypothetical protein